MSSWWGHKTRRAWRYVWGRVDDEERRALVAWLTLPQMRLFEAMHPADQRHGLDVVAALQAAGHDDPDLLLAGLFHDAAKGPTVGFGARVGWSLGQRYGPRVRAAFEVLPGYRAAFRRQDLHAEASARLARAAGCSERVAVLIRAQEGDVDPDSGVDPRLGEALRLADDGG